MELSGLRPPRSPRARALRMALMLLALALALAAPLGWPAALRQGLAALLRPSPTPYTVPGADRFYFLPTPPWVAVWMDGRRIGHVPLAADSGEPLRLAPGTHHIEWRGAPFHTLRCAVVVPVPFIYRPTPDACDIRPFEGLPAGYVLQYTESQATLSTAQQSALQTAIAAGLSAARAPADLPAGQPYLVPQPRSPSGYQLARAPAPLRATLSLMLDPNPGWTEPCAASGGSFQPCRFPGQDCRLLCTVASTSADGGAWLIAFMAQAAWDLARLDGAPAGMAAGGPHLGDVLVPALVTWDGAAWHATPVFGHAAGGELADDAVCGPARDWLAWGAAVFGDAAGPLVPGGPLQTGQSPGGVVFASGVDPTDGCYVAVPPDALAFTPQPPVTQSLEFLLRFGVLLAVNDTARQVAPGLPVANAAARAIALRLSASVSGAADSVPADGDPDGRY
jgi:hypothetical protein